MHRFSERAQRRDDPRWSVSEDDRWLTSGASRGEGKDLHRGCGRVVWRRVLRCWVSLPGVRAGAKVQVSGTALPDLDGAASISGCPPAWGSPQSPFQVPRLPDCLACSLRLPATRECCGRRYGKYSHRVRCRPAELQHTMFADARGGQERTVCRHIMSALDPNLWAGLHK